MKNYYSFIIITVLLWGFATNLQSQTIGLWPEPVNALVAVDEREYTVYKETKAVYRVHQVIHIYKPGGDKYARLKVYENKFSKCKKLKASIWTLDGQLLKKVKKKEFDVRTFLRDGVLYQEDVKVREADLSWNTYPYKVEFEYEIEFSSLFFWDDWLPQRSIPVLKSTYTLILKNDNIDFRTYYLSDSIAMSETHTKKGRKITWELTNIEPAEDSDWISHTEDVGILFSPVTFKLADYTATFDSWENIARWYYTLAQGRYTLPQAVRERVLEITAGVEDERAKVEILYRFLQDYTRYVAIYLGIGGWQPNPASSIYHRKYGDCKDLTTLMVAMLKQVGINAYPALTPTRDYRLLIEDFPSNQFNHCIAFVPLTNDTLWLECTADYLAAGDLPATVEGAKVLVVGWNKGEIVQTPVSPATENRWWSAVQGRLTSQGNFIFEGYIRTTGNQANWMRGNLIGLKREDKDSWVRSLVGKRASSVNMQYSVSNLDEDYRKPITLHISGTAHKFAKTSARRLFLTPSMLNGFSSIIIPEDETRDKPIFYKYAFLDVDSISIQIPSRYSLEAAPTPLHIKTDFGEYRMDFSFQNSILTYTRYYRINQIEIPPELYPQYRLFLKRVSKTDQAKFVFKK